MRSVLFLVVLGVSFARRASLEQRDLEPEDTSENHDDWPDIVERHDNGFFAAQFPLAQTDDPPAELAPIGSNLDEEDINTHDHIIGSAETLIAENPPSNKDNQDNTPAILKRDFFTWRVPSYLSGFQTSTIPVSIPVTITEGTEPPVFITKKINGPVTVTVTVTAIKSVTSFYNYAKTAFVYTLVPSTVTDEFLTFTYLTVPRQITYYVKLGVGAYTTLTSPVTVTVDEGDGQTETVTETFFRTRIIQEDTYAPGTTRTVAIPDYRTEERFRTLRPPPRRVTRTRRVIATTTTATTAATATGVSVLGADSPKPRISQTRTTGD